MRIHSLQEVKIDTRVFISFLLFLVESVNIANVLKDICGDTKIPHSQLHTKKMLILMTRVIIFKDS